jgi:hypothetical protein
MQQQQYFWYKSRKMKYSWKESDSKIEGEVVVVKCTFFFQQLFSRQQGNMFF